MIYTATTTSSNGNTRLVIVSISEGAYLGYMRNNQDGKYIATSYFGTDYKMTVSPLADDQIIINSTNVQPFEIKLNPTDAQPPTYLAQLAEGTLANAAINESYFKYAGNSIMVAPSINADGKADGVRQFCVSLHLDAPLHVDENELHLCRSLGQRRPQEAVHHGGLAAASPPCDEDVSRREDFFGLYPIAAVDGAKPILLCFCFLLESEHLYNSLLPCGAGAAVIGALCGTYIRYQI